MKIGCKRVSYLMIVLIVIAVAFCPDLARIGNSPGGQVVVLAITPTPSPLPVIKKYEFGTSTSPVETGYTSVNRYTAYTSGSFGWTDTYRMEDGDRGTPADNLKRDFCYSTQAGFSGRTLLMVYIWWST